MHFFHLKRDLVLLVLEQAANCSVFLPGSPLHDGVESVIDWAPSFHVIVNYFGLLEPFLILFWFIFVQRDGSMVRSRNSDKNIVFRRWE